MKRVLFVLSIILCNSSFSFQVLRSINSLDLAPGQSKTITIEVIKENVVGIGSLVEEIPEGFSVEELNNAGGHFVKEKSRLKIVWLTLPIGKSFTVSYKLINVAKISGDFILKGNFNYIENDTKKSTIITPLLLSVSGNSKIANKPAVKKVEEEKQVTSKVKNKAVVASTPVEAKKVPDTTKVEPITVYKVQLGVFSKEKDKSIFGNLPEVHFEMVNGLFKYYSGKFSNERDANSNAIKANAAGFKGAFVVKSK